MTITSNFLQFAWRSLKIVLDLIKLDIVLVFPGLQKSVWAFQNPEKQRTSYNPRNDQEGFENHWGNRRSKAKGEKLFFMVLIHTGPLSLKGRYTSSHLVYNPIITIKLNLGSIGLRSCEKMMKEKTPLLDVFVCFQIRIKDF